MELKWCTKSCALELYSLSTILWLPLLFLIKVHWLPPIVAYKSLFCLSLSYCFNSCFLSADLKVQWLTSPSSPICLWVLILFVFKVLLPLLLTCLLIVLFLTYIDSYIICKPLFCLSVGYNDYLHGWLLYSFQRYLIHSAFLKLFCIKKYHKS